MTSSAYLVIDLEATCSNDETVPRREMEIIEIGAVMAAADFRPIDEFQTFIRPVRHPLLTVFCNELTTIRQNDVDEAPGFATAISQFKRWLYGHNQDFLFCSWGDYDRHQLQQDCNFHRLPFPIGANHENVKKRFAAVQNIRKRPGLGTAVSMAGLEFDGTPHRGITDARNIARLLPFIYGTARLPAAV